MSDWFGRCGYLAGGVLGAGLMAGCGSGTVGAVPAGSAPGAPTTVGGGAVQGVGVHGRAQSGPLAVTGSHIYLLAANTSGYGAASVSLLDPTGAGAQTDAIGAYVTTDRDGSFKLGSYSCAPKQLVYILAKGGRALGTEAENPGLALISLVGACPEAGNFAGTTVFVNISEASTVASVYALAGFMTDAAHVSSAATEKSFRGMTNAFLTASSIFDAASGRALVSTPSGTGVVSQAKVNTLANIVASCVNSSPACGRLFAEASDAKGVPATDTVTALLNIARNPGANVPALFALSGTQPFRPALGTAPNDWTVAITFSAEGMAGAYYPAFDSVGNLWVPDYANNTLTEFDPLGNVLSGDRGFSGGGLSQPFSVAIDARDNAWVTNYGAGTVGGPSVSEFGSSGVPLSRSGFPCGTGCTFMAIDATENLWVSGGPQVEALRSAAGTPIAIFSTNTMDSGIAVDSRGRGWVIGQGRKLFRLALSGQADAFPESVTAASGVEVTPLAVDGGDNVWFASSKMDAVGKHDGNGVAISPPGGYTGGGLKGPAGLAIDGANTVWVANRDGNSISEFSNAGVAISPASGYRSTGISNPRGIAVDGSGNVWVTNFTGNSVTEFLGLGAPTVTPVTPGSHGQRP